MNKSTKQIADEIKKLRDQIDKNTKELGQTMSLFDKERMDKALKLLEKVKHYRNKHNKNKVVEIDAYSPKYDNFITSERWVISPREFINEYEPFPLAASKLWRAVNGA